ncbi:MAG: hypothetical protein IKX79_03680 [Desulfovibrionaceae bacterium]|nr:hypothetical protein [Desulfovibrionaceae bacterium]
MLELPPGQWNAGIDDSGTFHADNKSDGDREYTKITLQKVFVSESPDIKSYYDEESKAYKTLFKKQLRQQDSWFSLSGETAEGGLAYIRYVFLGEGEAYCLSVKSAAPQKETFMYTVDFIEKHLAPDPAAASSAPAVSASLPAGSEDTQRVPISDSLGTGVIMAELSPVNTYRTSRGTTAKDRNLRIARLTGSGETLWTVRDGIERCESGDFSVALADSIAVTDLDGNGLSEVWMVYKLLCRAERRPAPMKIIMYEGKKKFAARGRTAIAPRGNAPLRGGEYAFDANFRDAPKSFRVYADKLWKKCGKE